MTWIVDIIPKYRLSAKFATGLAITAILALGMFPASAEAQYRRHYNNYYNGGYYHAPPLIYGSRYRNYYYGNRYYYPPPVVYGPSIGITLPFVGIGIGIH
jgi:hypothetical protein